MELDSLGATTADVEGDGVFSGQRVGFLDGCSQGHLGTRSVQIDINHPIAQRRLIAQIPRAVDGQHVRKQLFIRHRTQAVLVVLPDLGRRQCAVVDCDFVNETGEMVRALVARDIVSTDF